MSLDRVPAHVGPALSFALALLAITGGGRYYWMQPRQMDDARREEWQRRMSRMDLGPQYTDAEEFNRCLGY